MTDFREPYVEGKENLQTLLDSLREKEPVSIEIIIKNYFEDNEKYFIIEYRPTLPIAIEADTEEEAKIKAKEAVKFLIKNESQDRSIDLDWDLLEFQITIADRS